MALKLESPVIVSERVSYWFDAVQANPKYFQSAEDFLRRSQSGNIVRNLQFVAFEPADLEKGLVVSSVPARIYAMFFLGTVEDTDSWIWVCNVDEVEKIAVSKADWVVRLGPEDSFLTLFESNVNMSGGIAISGRAGQASATKVPAARGFFVVGAA